MRRQRPPSSSSGLASTDNGTLDRRWRRHAEVLKHLAVDHRILQVAMRSTPDHIEKPWVDVGTQAAPRYRWDATRVDAWWKELHAWRRSKEEQTDTLCGGVTLTAPRVPVPAQKRRPRTASSPTSSELSPKGGVGSLLTLVQSLTSK